MGDSSDLCVINLNTFNKLPDIALPERRVVAAKAMTSGIGKSGNIVLRQQPARDLFAYLERGNVADQIFAFIFDLGEGTAEHCGVVHRALCNRAVKALDP